MHFLCGVNCVQSRLLLTLSPYSLSQVWDRHTLECTRVLQGHTGSVLCLQYDENVVVTGSSDSTIR